MVDTVVSKAIVERRVGSNPTWGICLKYTENVYNILRRDYPTAGDGTTLLKWRAAMPCGIVPHSLRCGTMKVLA